MVCLTARQASTCCGPYSATNRPSTGEKLLSLCLHTATNRTVCEVKSGCVGGHHHGKVFQQLNDLGIWGIYDCRCFSTADSFLFRLFIEDSIIPTLANSIKKKWKMYWQYYLRWKIVIAVLFLYHGGLSLKYKSYGPECNSVKIMRQTRAKY